MDDLGLRVESRLWLRLDTEFDPDPGLKGLLTRTFLASSLESTVASVSLSRLIRKQSKDTIMLDIKATKAKEPITPAKTTDPRQIESVSRSKRGSESKLNLKLIQVKHYFFTETLLRLY